MSSLRDIQNHFQRHLMYGETQIEQSVVNTKPVSVTTRLAIYKDACQIRLVEALASNFPCLQTHMGQEKFQKLGLAYLASHPSHYRSIRWFGDQLVDYLTQYPEKNAPWLAELAEFEWNMSAAFDAADADLLTLVDISTLPGEAWPDLVLTPHPSVHRMNFLWNVVPLWQSIVEKNSSEEIRKGSASGAWILWRKDYTNRFLSLSDEEAWAIDAAIKGATFADICEGLCVWNGVDTVGMRAASLLKGWILSGWISGLEFPGKVD